MTELSLVAKATVILGLALVLTRAARCAPASVRAFILAATFGLLLVQPIASALAPAREVQIPDAYAPPFLLADEAAVGRPPDVVAASRSAAAGTPRSVPLPSPASLARGIWVLGAVVTLGPLLLGLRRSRTIRREAREWADGAVLASTLRDAIGLRRSVSVVLHDDLVSPMTCGWRQPAIVMPADSPAWAVADVRQALLHELEHVRRHDWAVHILARFTCALYWFHPGAWMAWRRLTLESERACDDAVVALAEHTAYAEQLVSLARRLAKPGPVPLLSMADRRTLSARVASILSTSTARGPVSTVMMAVVLAGAAVLAVAIAPIQARSSPQTPGSPSFTIDPALRFGVVSVRPNDGSDPSRGFGFTLESGRLRLRNQTLRTMISVAYSQPFGLFFPDERISGGPEWMNRDRFTIEARAERAVTASEMGAMLRALLADRFNLTVRVETKQAPIFALILAKQDGSLGTNLKRTEVECVVGAGRCGIGGGRGRYQLAAASMPLLATSLSELVGRPIVDRTGLTGSFDGTLTWAPAPEELGALGQPAPEAPEFGASLFTALEEQFGLKLQAERGGVDYLAVTNADQPTPNDATDRQADVQVAGAATPPTLPSFDVVSVKPNTGSDTSIPFVPVPPDGIHVVNRPLESLVRQAYDIQYFRVIGMPAWANQERFDITAKAARPITVEERRLMLRQLLADRFGVKVHFEPRENTVYVMTRARADGALGPGLQRRPECPAASDKCVSAGSAIGPAGRLSLKAATLDLLASGLMSAVLEGLVVNESNVDGHFDVELSWRPDTAIPANDPRPSFTTAVEEQLGMKLTAQKRSVQVLVIDQIQRPTAN